MSGGPPIDGADGVDPGVFPAALARAIPLLDPGRIVLAGAGTGLTALLLAAHQPSARLWAAEREPRHAATTAALARAAGLTNLHMMAGGLAALTRRRPPAGGADLLIVRRLDRGGTAALADSARRWVAPGGVLAVTYACKPGCADAVPLARALAAHRARRPNEDAVAAVRAWAARGYGVAHPNADRWLDALAAGMADAEPRGGDAPWTPPFHAEVRARLEQAGLGFAGELAAAPSVPAACHELMAAAPDAAMAATLADAVTHRWVRREVYQRPGEAGEHAASAGAARAAARRLNAVLAAREGALPVAHLAAPDRGVPRPADGVALAAYDALARGARAEPDSLAAALAARGLPGAGARRVLASDLPGWRRSGAI